MADGGGVSYGADRPSTLTTSERVLAGSLMTFAALPTWSFTGWRNRTAERSP